MNPPTLGEQQRWMSLPVFCFVCAAVIIAFICLTGCTNRQNEWQGIANTIKGRV